MTRHTTVEQAGEAGTIAAIRSAAPSSINGDDAAVLDSTASNSRQVCSTDILVRGRHFRFRYSSPFEVGVKAVSQNFADIQAMGGRPTALLLAIATPGDMELGPSLSWLGESIRQPLPLVQSWWVETWCVPRTWLFPSPRWVSWAGLLQR